MSSHTTHPLVGSYLSDLELLLHGIEPGERAEVLAGVREHLDGSLAPGADDASVRAVLAELGPPQAIADEAYAGRPAPSPRRTPALSRAWVPISVGVLLALALLTTITVIGAFSTYATSESGTYDAAGRAITTQHDVDFTGVGPSGILMALLASWLFWVPATVLSLASPLWSPRQKVALCLLTPAAVVVMALLPTIGWEALGTELGINLGSWTSLALVVVGGGLLLTHLCRAAARKVAS